MNKLFVLMIVALLLIGLPILAQAQWHFQPAEASYEFAPGENFTIEIILSGSGVDVDAFGFDVYYPDGLLQYDGSNFTGTLIEGWNFKEVNEYAPGALKVAGFTISGMITSPASGVWVKLNFTVKDGVSGTGEFLIGAFGDDLLTDGSTSSPASFTVRTTAGNNITFKIDMNYLNSIGLFDSATEGAAVRGSFSNWHDTPENLPDWVLTDDNSDLVYEGTFDVGEDSPIQYKFVTYILGTTNVQYESGNNRSLILTGMPQELNPVVWDIEVTFRVDMNRAQRLGLFNPESNGVSLRGNFTSWNDDPATLPDWALTDLGGNMLYTGTFSMLNTAELAYKYVITDKSTNLLNWEDAISNRMDTLTTVQDVTFDIAFWDSIPPPAEAITANVLFKVDVTPLLELGAFDPTLGDTLQLRGEFNGWSDSDPERSIMRQSLLSLTQYELTIDIEAVPGDELPYKFFISYDDQGGSRDIPESGWEEPASTGGANRFYTFTEQVHQTVPTKFFNDIYIEDVIPEGVTINVEMTAVMTCVQRDLASGLPAGGPLQLDEQDPIWRFITGTPNVDDVDTELVYQDANNDSIYNLSFDLVGPVPNWIQYRLQWAGQDEEGSDTQAAGRRRVRYVRKNPDGSWPAVFKMGLDVWNDVVASPLVVETRDGGTINDEVPCDIEVSVEATDLTIPTEYKLEQNYPNPFNPMTTIEYSLKKVGHVTITIYNQLGQQVAVLVDQHQSAGSYKITWNINDSMRELPSGIYFYHLKAGQFQDTKRLVLLK